MTVSGEMTIRRRFSIRFMEVFMGLVYGGVVIGLFLLVSWFLEHNHWQPLDRDTKLACIAGAVVVALLAFVLSRWQDADVVVEFACDGRSFQFRRIGGARAETRGLSEVAKVVRGTGRGPLRFQVVFQDGGQAVLWCEDLPNAAVVAEWLGSHIQGR